MKLSNKDLHYALWCAEKHTGNSLYAEAMADLDEGVLEIEGYEKINWTKFDPNDESTFPKEKDGHMFMVHQIYKGESIFNIATSNVYFWGQCNVTHWRPLPNPPVETKK